MGGFNWSLNDGIGALGVAAGAGVAGGFGTPSSSSGNGTSDTTTNATSSTNQSLSSLLATLSQLNGKTASTTTSTGTTTGGYATPGATNLSNQVGSQYANLAQSSTNLQPYESQQVEQINQNSNSQSQAQQAALAARGLSTSPVAGTVAAQTQAQRVGQISNLESSIPLLQQQLTTQNLSAANSYLANAPKTQAVTGTQDQTGTTSQTGSTTQTGSQTGTGSTNSSGTQDTTTTQQQKASSGGGVGGILSGVLGALSFL